MHHYLHASRHTVPHIVERLLDCLVDVFELHLRPGTDLGKPVGDSGKPLHILVDFIGYIFVGTCRGKVFRPRHQRRYRRAELMGRLLGEADPYPVLFRPLGVDHGYIKDECEDKHHHHLDVGIQAQAAEHTGILIVDVLVDAPQKLHFYEMVVMNGGPGN